MALAGQSRYLEISMLNTSSRQGSEPTLVTLSAAKGLVWGAHGVSIRKRTCCLSPLSAGAAALSPSLKGKLREGEGSGDSGAEIRRCTQDDMIGWTVSV